MNLCRPGVSFVVTSWMRASARHAQSFERGALHIVGAESPDVVGGAHDRAGMTNSLFDRRGILLRRDALTRGLDDNWLGRMVRSQALIRIRQGAYADPQVWHPGVAKRATRSPELGRDASVRRPRRPVTCQRRRTPGGPTWGLDLGSVHLTNLFGRGDRTQAGVTHHRGTCLVIDVSRHDGHWITAPARNAMETAVLTGRDSAVAVLDWFMNQSLATREDCRRLVDPLMREWAGTVDLSSRLDLARAKRASVGETRTGCSSMTGHTRSPSASGRCSGQTVGWPASSTSPSTTCAS